jgi:hypothetical protein
MKGRKKEADFFETVQPGSIMDPHRLSIRIRIQGAKLMQMQTDPDPGQTLVKVTKS